MQLAMHLAMQPAMQLANQLGGDSIWAWVRSARVDLSKLFPKSLAPTIGF